MAWASDDLVLSHGTESDQVPNIGLGLSIANCRTATDFGQGFYLTTSEHQAKQWANATRERNLHSNPAMVAVVMRIDVKRNVLADLEALVFVVDNPDYWSFVNYCRGGSAPHARKKLPPAEYDVVYGPVALWKQTLVIKDCDQVSAPTHYIPNALPDTASSTADISHSLTNRGVVGVNVRPNWAGAASVLKNGHLTAQFTHQLC
jgi:uncharacterized protein DUF3990